MKRLVAALALALSFMATGPALAWESPEDTQHWLINTERVDRGLSRLEVTDFLTNYAEGVAQRMANQGRVFHDPCAGCSEVVGVVPKTSGPGDIFDAWMASDEHRFVILYPPLDRLGCGKVTQDGFDWWACEFRF